MNLDVIAARVFTQPEFAQEVFPMPAHPSPLRKLDSHAGQVKEASMRFIHGNTISTGDATRGPGRGLEGFAAFYREKPARPRRLVA
jgi:hypothetical protein